MTSHEDPIPPEQTVASAYSGTGDDVVGIVKPNSEGVLAVITGNDAREHFAVEGLDGNQELLVNTSDPYTGTILLDAQGGETTQLQVTATGRWTIVLHPVDSAPRFTDTISGQGDGVVINEGTGGGLRRSLAIGSTNTSPWRHSAPRGVICW